MLEEIYSPVFKIGKETRAPIHFEEGLNVVLGDDLPDNSIGKSSFLLAIDFAYGGITYPTKEIKTERLGIISFFGPCLLMMESIILRETPPIKTLL
jgi:predicted ATP-dependent endonuclease of OLD family